MGLADETDGNVSALGQVLGAECPSAPCPRRAVKGLRSDPGDQPALAMLFL